MRGNIQDGLGLGWAVGTWGQGKVSRMQHGVGKLVNNGEGLGMEVSKHGIRAPTANEADDVSVDWAAQ